MGTMSPDGGGKVWVFVQGLGGKDTCLQRKRDDFDFCEYIGGLYQLSIQFILLYRHEIFCRLSSIVPERYSRNLEPRCCCAKKKSLQIRTLANLPRILPSGPWKSLFSSNLVQNRLHASLERGKHGIFRLSWLHYMIFREEVLRCVASIVVKRRCTIHLLGHPYLVYRARGRRPE